MCANTRPAAFPGGCCLADVPAALDVFVLASARRPQPGWAAGVLLRQELLRGCIPARAFPGPAAPLIVVLSEGVCLPEPYLIPPEALQAIQMLTP